MKDVFGTGLKCYLDGDRERALMVRRDDGWTAADGPGHYFGTTPKPLEADVSRYLHGRVLDVGCGAGRHVLACQARGLEVLGVDASRLAIEVCKARGCRTVRHTDIFEMELPETPFHTILLFGKNVGIGGTLDGVGRLLMTLRGMIREDGALLLTSTDVVETESEIHLAYHRRNLDAGRARGQMNIRLEYGDAIGDWFDWVHVSPSELEDVAKGSGWSVGEICLASNGEYSAALKPVSN